jgi:peptide/nickel transport system substrate-binding protein
MTVLKNHARGGVLVGFMVAALLAALIGLHFSAASKADSASPSAQASASGTAGQKIVRVGWLQEPDNLNPFIGIQGTSYELYHLNYDFLVGFDTKTYAPRPEIADSWSASPDGKVWTFKIHPGLKWQDGQPLTAKDVAFTFNYIIKNNLTNLSAYTDGITKATAPDDTTAVLYCSAPKANILHMVVPIVPEHIWSKVTGKAITSTYANNPPVIGSGPYQIVEWQRGKFVRLKANPYYRLGKPKIDELIFTLYTNSDTMVSDLKLGTIDAAVNIPRAQFQALQTTPVPGITTNAGDIWQFTELAFNCYNSPNSKGNPVLLDPKFRQALSWAVDKQKVVDIAFGGLATLGSSLIVPWSPYHWEPPASEAYTYDPAKAKQLLAAAGYKDVNHDGYLENKQGKLLNLRLYVTSDDPENGLTSKYVAGWFRDVGIRTTLSSMDPGTLINDQYNYVNNGKTYAPDWDLFIWYWTYDVDPQFQMSIYTPQQIEGWNDCCWTDPEYTRLNALQSTDLSATTRTATIKKMEEIFYKAAPYIIFTYPKQLEAWRSDRWTGWTKAPADIGTAVYNYSNIDSYVNIAPNTAKSGGSGSSNTGLIVGLVAAAVVVLGILVFVLTRRRGGAVEE